MVVYVVILVGLVGLIGFAVYDKASYEKLTEEGAPKDELQTMYISGPIHMQPFRLIFRRHSVFTIHCNVMIIVGYSQSKPSLLSSG
jgi:hypothetical protein